MSYLTFTECGRRGPHLHTVRVLFLEAVFFFFFACGFLFDDQSVGLAAAVLFTLWFVREMKSST
jgi:hypothetical protein